MLREWQWTGSCFKDSVVACAIVAMFSLTRLCASLRGTLAGYIRVRAQSNDSAVQGGSPQDADTVALELAALVDRLGCGWCLVWAKHDSLVTAAKAAAPQLDVRPEKYCFLFSSYLNLNSKLPENERKEVHEPVGSIDTCGYCY